MSILGSIIGGVLNIEAADAQRDAAQNATDRQIELFERIYNDQRDLNQPLVNFRDQRLSYLNGLRGFGGGGQSGAAPVQTQATPQRPQAGGSLGAGLTARIGQDGAYMPVNAFATPYATGAQPQASTQPQGQQWTQDSAMQAFYDSPEYRMALMGFEDQGDQFLTSKAATGGLYSGATLRGLSDIERRNAFGAWGNYYGNIMSEAGFGQAGANNQQNATQSYGNNVGNALGYQGMVNSQAAGRRYSAYGNAFADIGNSLSYAAGMGFGG